MEKYEEITLTRNDLFNRYESFMFIEGQQGLPDLVKDIYNVIYEKGLETWVLEKVFDNPERIKSIPYLNPSVIIFQTTMMSFDKIKDIVYYLQKNNYKPMEIWQIIRNDIPVVDSDEYNVFSPYVDNNQITLMKL
jgi:hypothetical protein